MKEEEEIKTEGNKKMEEIEEIKEIEKDIQTDGKPGADSESFPPYS